MAEMPVRYALVILLGTLLPHLAAAQAPSPGQQCERNRQGCVRRCTGADTQACFASCAASHAQCLRNPTAQSRRPVR